MKIARLAAFHFALTAAATLQAQSFYGVGKSQNFLQTSATGVTADPTSAFAFTAQAATNATLTLPAGTATALVRGVEDNRYLLRQFFASQAALDAAFPNGTYRLSGSAIPTLSLPLTTDLYPVTTPQVTSVSNGSWNAGGILVVDPAQNVTLNFSRFSGYTTSGLAGHINFHLSNATGESGGVPVRLESERFSQAIFGSPAQPTPLTTYTIPAGTLTPGRVYQAWLDFDTVTAMDIVAVPVSAVGTLFSKEVKFYLAAQIAGTSTPPPVIVTPLANAVAVIGGATTFSIAITLGGTRVNYQNSSSTFPIQFEWKRDGQDLGKFETSGGKYTGMFGDTLTFNSLTAADAGSYTVTAITAGGIVTTAPATLTFAAPSAPATRIPPAAPHPPIRRPSGLAWAMPAKTPAHHPAGNSPGPTGG